MLKVQRLLIQFWKKTMIHIWKTIQVEFSVAFEKNRFGTIIK